MRIVFTHNLQLSDREEEAEFDSPATVRAIGDTLRALGHEVELLEVSGPASRLVARLEALRPDLVFNTAEGSAGRTRTAFYPALFDQLGLPYTGSGPWVCTLALDKHLAKLTLAAQGIPTPRWALFNDAHPWRPVDLTFPVIVKPNFEGSSKGIDADAVVESREELERRIKELLARYPAGVIAEEFVAGVDVSVPFLEKVGPLPPAEYVFDPEAVRHRRYNVYDYELKHRITDAVNVRAPAALSPDTAEELARLARRAYQVLGIRDFGRLDFRVSPEGRPFFIEANPSPSLEAGVSLYASAAQVGLKSMGAVLGAILDSAARRHGVEVKAAPKRAQRLRVGFTYNVKRIVPNGEGDDDSQAEYDSPKTIAAIRDAIASYGHEVVELECTPELPSLLPAAGVDVVFNIAEGWEGRNREAQIPALLELLNIPYTGSDPATLAITLDKALAKRIVMQAGVMTPRFVLMRTGNERLPKDLRFPVIAKPVAEGSSKGVFGASVVGSEKELRELARELAGRYRQGALVEEFLTGREFTVALLGERRPRALPPMEIVFLDEDDAFPVYGFEQKLDTSSKIRYDAPADVDPALGKELARVAKLCFTELGCRDVARIDLRLDAAGRVNFIECNPLPGLTPDWSDLCLIAKAAGMDYRTLIGEILAPAIRRFQERNEARQGGARTKVSPA